MSEEYDDFDDDFDDIDEMDGMGFEDADNESPDEDRGAIMNTFNGSMSSFMDDFKDTNKIKQVGDVADAAFKAAAGKEVSKNYEALKGTFNKELSKSTRELKTAAKPFVNKLKDTLPEDSAVGRLVDKLDGFLGKERSNDEESEEARIARESNELVLSVFGEQSKRLVLDQTITALANKNRDDLLRQITAVGQTTLEFHNSNTLGYYKKSIELKYQHLFESKRTFKLQLKSFETFKRQFETIVKNTALPDFVKIRGMEVAKQQINQRIIGQGYESAMNMGWVQNAKDNITNRFRSTTEGIVDGLNAGTEVLDMATEMGEQFEDPDARNMLLGSMGADSTRTVSGRILGKIFSKTKRGKAFKDELSKINADPGTYFGNVQDKHAGSEGILGRTKGWLAGSAANLVSLNDNYAPYRDLQNEGPDTATFFDNRTKKSITTVIPSLLSKIYGSVESIRTGDDPDGVLYDHDKGAFVKYSDVKTNLVNTMNNATSKAHSVNIENFVKTLVTGAGVKFTPEELYKFATRLTSFGIRDKNIKLANLEEKGFFKGLDANTEMLYRRVFENIGKGKDGKIDWLVRGNIDKAMDQAINIRSNPEKIIKKAIDDGYTEQLIELRILKWDAGEDKYIIDMVQFDKYSIIGINKKLFEEREELETQGDGVRKAVKDTIVNAKRKALDKIVKLTDGIVDKLATKLETMESNYDDPEAKSYIRTAKQSLERAKEEAYNGKDVNKTSNALKKEVKAIENMLKGQLSAMKKGKKSGWKTFKDVGKGIFDKLKNTNLGSSIKDDVGNIADRTANAARAANDKISEDFDYDIFAKVMKSKSQFSNVIEQYIISHYELEIGADAETIKAMTAIVNARLKKITKKDLLNLNSERATAIIDDIQKEIEDAGLNLKGMNTQTAKDDFNAGMKASKKKAKAAAKKANSWVKEETGFDINDIVGKGIDEASIWVTKNALEALGLDIKADKKAFQQCIELANNVLEREAKSGKSSRQAYKIAYREVVTAIETYEIKFKGIDTNRIKTNAKEGKDKTKAKGKSLFGKAKGFFNRADEKVAEDRSWIESLTSSIGKLTSSISKPKFGLFDKDKDGDRDGGTKDRLEFFKRTKTKTKEKKSKDGKDKKSGGPLSLILKVLTGALGIGGSMFATAFKGIGAVLTGMPAGLGAIVRGISGLSGIMGILGTAVKFGFKSVMMALSLGGGIWKGAGKLDKIVSPKLKMLLKPKRLAMLVGGGLLADHFSPEIKAGAKKVWGGISDAASDGWDYFTGSEDDVVKDMTIPPVNNKDYMSAVDNNDTYGNDSTSGGSVGLEMGGMLLAEKGISKYLDRKPKPVNNVVEKGAKAGAGKMAGKILSKALPGVAAVTYGLEAEERFASGNYVGGSASAVAAGLSVMFPFVGGMVGAGLSYITEEDTPEDNMPEQSGSSEPVSKTSTPAMLKILLDRIAKGEIGHTGAKGYSTSLDFGKWAKGFKPIHTMTISEVYRLQATMRKRGARSNAVGRYQFIHITLKEVVEKLKLDPNNTIFSPDMQDTLIVARLYKTRQLGAWLKGEISDDAFIFNLSKEFASIACPFNTTRKGKRGKIIKVKKGESYYGQGMHTSLEAMRATLKAMKRKGGAVVNDTVDKQGEENKPKTGKMAKGILSAIKGLFDLLGIDMNPKAVSDLDLGDGTPVYDDAGEGYGKTTSSVNGNDIKGGKDKTDQLGGIPYKYVSMPKHANKIIEPEYIVTHNTAGSSLYLGRMKASGIGTAIWIDTNGDVIVVNNILNRTWHVGPTKNLKGGNSQPVRSSNSIGIEMVCAYNKKEKKWNRYTDKQIASLKRVGAFLMSKFKIDKEHVKAHIEVAFKTKGEGMEAAAILKGVVLADTAVKAAVADNMNKDAAATIIPDVSLPDYRVSDADLGDGTPVYEDLTLSGKRRADRVKANIKKNDEWLAKQPKMDLNKTLQDIDLSMGKSLAPIMNDMVKELKINNKYQEDISANVRDGNNVEVTIKDEKGKTIPKNIVAPNKISFDRAG